MKKVLSGQKSVVILVLRGKTGEKGGVIFMSGVVSWF